MCSLKKQLWPLKYACSETYSQKMIKEDGVGKKGGKKILPHKSKGNAKTKYSVHHRAFLFFM